MTRNTLAVVLLQIQDNKIQTCGFLSKAAVLAVVLSAFTRLVFPESTCPRTPTLKLNMFSNDHRTIVPEVLSTIQIQLYLAEQHRTVPVVSNCTSVKGAHSSRIVTCVLWSAKCSNTHVPVLSPCLWIDHCTWQLLVLSLNSVNADRQQWQGYSGVTGVYHSVTATPINFNTFCSAIEFKLLIKVSKTKKRNLIAIISKKLSRSNNINKNF